MQPYILRPTGARDGEELNALYNKITGLHRTLAQWRWEWLDGPLGPSPSWVIVEASSQRIVGHHGVVPVPLILGNRLLTAARTENSMVDPDYRGKFMYTAFEAQVLADLLGRFDILFTTAGGGTPGAIRRRLGYSELGKWHTFSPGIAIGHRIARVIALPTLPRAFANLPKRWHPRDADLELTHDPDRLERVWQKRVASERIEASRTSAFLAWRVLNHPKTAFRMGVIKKDGDDRGGIVWRDELDARGARLVTVEDIFTIDDDFGRALDTLSAHVRGTAARIIVRTLDNHSPLAVAARQRTLRWAIAKGAGSPVFVRTRHSELLSKPWLLTQILTQGM